MENYGVYSNYIHSGKLYIKRCVFDSVDSTQTFST